MKSHLFLRVWLLIGVIAANTTSLYGMQTTEMLRFLTQKGTPNIQQSEKFISSLYALNRDLSVPSKAMNASMQLNTISQSNGFTSRVEDVLNSGINKTDKRQLAEIYFEIKFNQSIPASAKLPMTNVIKSHLPEGYLKALEGQKTTPKAHENGTYPQRLTGLNKMIFELNNEYRQLSPNAAALRTLLNDTVGVINRQYSDILRITDQFKIGLLSENLKEIYPNVVLTKLNFTPNVPAEEILNKEDIDRLSRINKNEKWAAGSISLIHSFFAKGCKAEDATVLIQAVILLAKDKDSAFDAYKIKFAKSRIFNIICQAIIDGPNFKEKQVFTDSYKHLASMASK